MAQVPLQFFIAKFKDIKTLNKRSSIWSTAMAYSKDTKFSFERFVIRNARMYGTTRKITNQMHNPLENYTASECEIILDKVNKANLENLLCYQISKVRASKLLTCRQQHGGAFSNIQDIATIKGFGLNFVDKFCQRLLNEESVSNPNEVSKTAIRQRVAPLMTPNIDVEHRQSILSSVGIRIGVSSITWSRLEVPAWKNSNELLKPCALTHWEHYDIIDKKLHLSELIKRCAYIDRLIPMADCYIFENPHVAQINANPGNSDQQNIYIQKEQINAVLGYSLAARASTAAIQSQKTRSNVFYLRRYLTARLFKNLIGNERISSEETVKGLMGMKYNLVDEAANHLADNSDITNRNNAKETANVENTNNKPLPINSNVEFPQDLQENFTKAGRVHREFLSQALLLNLAFIRLIIIQDPQSIALISRQSIRK